MNLRKFFFIVTICLLVNALFSEIPISVLLVYSDDARVGAGGATNIENKLISDVDDGNFALTNSNTQIEIRIAGFKEVSLNEGLYGSLSALNSDLQNSQNPVFSPIHKLRDQKAADMVFLVVEGIEANGQAFKLCGHNDPCDNNFEQFAFASGQRGTMMMAPYLLVHELGHVMGLHHDRTRDCGSEALNCEPAVYPYSWGHIDPTPPTSWGTIMAGGRPFGLVDFFSNPNLQHPTTGQALGIFNVSDASQSIRNTRYIVGGWRHIQIPPVISAVLH